MKVAGESQYFFLRDSQFDLLNACLTDDQKNLVLSNLLDARRNYWNCINKTFPDDDPAVAAAVAQTKAAEEELESANQTPQRHKQSYRPTH